MHTTSRADMADMDICNLLTSPHHNLAECSNKHCSGYSKPMCECDNVDVDVSLRVCLPLCFLSLPPNTIIVRWVIPFLPFFVSFIEARIKEFRLNYIIVCVKSDH